MDDSSQRHPAPDPVTTPTAPVATSDAERRLVERVGSQAKPRTARADEVMEVAARIESRPDNEPPAPDAKAVRQKRIDDRWKALVESIGVRYEPCRLRNFETGDNKKISDAIVRLSELAKGIEEHVKAGGNVILYGPPGTGKDHLLVALMRTAILADLSAEWINGQDLFGKLRDRIETSVTEEKSIRDYCKADVLGISDPVPPKGEASSYSAMMLYRIVDRRYRELKSTWVTMNVADAAEATRELTGPVFDRLRDNCVAVYCNWPSYRESRKPKWLEVK